MLYILQVLAPGSCFNLSILVFLTYENIKSYFVLSSIILSNKMPCMSKTSIIMNGQYLIIVYIFLKLLTLSVIFLCYPFSDSLLLV